MAQLEAQRMVWTSEDSKSQLAEAEEMYQSGSLTTAMFMLIVKKLGTAEDLLTAEQNVPPAPLILVAPTLDNAVREDDDAAAMKVQMEEDHVSAMRYNWEEHEVIVVDDSEKGELPVKEKSQIGLASFEINDRFCHIGNDDHDDDDVSDDDDDDFDDDFNEVIGGALTETLKMKKPPLGKAAIARASEVFKKQGLDMDAATLEHHANFDEPLENCTWTRLVDNLKKEKKKKTGSTKKRPSPPKVCLSALNQF
jgi:hypothetical protein